MYTVVIVEDDPIITQLNRRYAEKDGRFTVTQTFSSPRRALDWLTRHPADLVILDFYRPQMNGLELLRAIRAAGVESDVIMITAANEYERMMSEYPEDDSGDRLLEVWQEQVEKARKAANPQAASDSDDDAEEDSEPEFRMDMSVLNNVPRHVGLDFVTEDDDEDRPETTEEDSDEDDVPETPEEPHVGIGPVASSPDDAVDAVPPVEKVRLGPGAPDEVRFFLDSKYGRIERIGPVSSSALDAVDSVDDVLATFMPPSHPDEFAKWYGRHLQSEHPTWGRVEGYDDGDDGIVLVARPREDPDGTDGSDVDRNEKGVDARACDHGSGNTPENDDDCNENKDVDARPRKGDTEEGA